MKKSLSGNSDSKFAHSLKSVLFRYGLSSLFLLSFINAFAQGSADSGTGNDMVLLLFSAVMVLTLFLVTLLGDKIIKSLTNEQGFGLFPKSDEINPPSLEELNAKSEVIKLKKGMDIKIAGTAQKKIEEYHATTYAICPIDFKGIKPIPQMLFQVGDEVKAGDIVFHDKVKTHIKWASPVSGEIVEIRRGEKRKIEEVVILADKNQSYRSGKKQNPKKLTKEKTIAALLESGLWPCFIQRPYGYVADVEVNPKAIHISAFDTSPLAPLSELAMEAGSSTEFQAGLDVLNNLTDHVHLNIDARRNMHPTLSSAEGVHKNYFQGEHPAGNVGIQIHHIDPIGKDETVWTIKIQDVFTIGRFFLTGKYDPVKIITVGGPVIKDPKYYKTKTGAAVKGLLENNIEAERGVRIISGNVLTGRKISEDMHLGHFANTLSVIEEGDFHEMFGWLLPSYPRPSASVTIPYKFMPWLRFPVNTNTHGERRAFVVSGQYEEVLPMDIYPVHLLKAIIANDFDGMEGLGIYELLEEDIALCEFVCTSKQPAMSILREGLDFVHEQS